MNLSHNSATYSKPKIGFIIIWAKLSDIFGRKLFLMIAILLFIVFSGACGGSQTALQLYVDLSWALLVQRNV